MLDKKHISVESIGNMTAKRRVTFISCKSREREYSLQMRSVKLASLVSASLSQLWRNLCKFSCAIKVIFFSYSLKIARAQSCFTAIPFFFGCQKLVRVHFLTISLCCLNEEEPCSSGHPQRCTNFEIALFLLPKKSPRSKNCELKGERALLLPGNTKA